MDKIKKDENMHDYLVRREAREVLEELTFEELLERHMSTNIRRNSNRALAEVFLFLIGFLSGVIFIVFGVILRI